MMRTNIGPNLDDPMRWTIHRLAVLEQLEQVDGKTENVNEFVDGCFDGEGDIAGEEFHRTEIGVSRDGSLKLVLLAMLGVGNDFVSHASCRGHGLHVQDHVSV